MPVVLLAALLAADPAPRVALPPEVRAAPGRLLTLTADTPGKQVKWALASDDADLVPFPDGKVALFVGPKPGRYLVLAWSAAGDVPGDAARCVIVVGDPPTPGPTDPLLADLQKLYQADATPNRAAHAAQLAALYREAVRFADRPEVATAGDLAGRIRTAASSLVPADALVPLRKRLAEEIAAALPTDGESALTPALRKAASDTFARLATLLEQLP